MSGRVVLDASAALRLVLGLRHAPDLAALLDRASVVLVPQLFSSEVANGLWKYVRHGTITREQAVARYEEAVGLPDSFQPDRSLAIEALSEAAARNHPVYDLLYAVLARRYAARLVTFDDRLADVASEMGVEVR